MPSRETPPPPPGDQGAEPSKATLDQCRRCELWEHATQGVAGEGPRDARTLLVGEQPGDEEDPEGTPIIATYHPSAALRAPDHDARAKLRATLLSDLKRAARIAAKG